MYNKFLGLGYAQVKEKTKGHTHIWECIGNIKLLGFWNWLIGRHCWICKKCNERINAW